MFGSRCAETTSTAGGGPTLTLAGAITGWQAISNEFWDATNSTGVPFQYWCENLDGTEVEAGTGYLTATTTLVRDTAPEYTLSGGVSGSGTVVTFSAGVKRVFAAPIGRGIMPTLPTINTTAAASERLESTAFPVGTASTATLLNDKVYYVPFYHSCMDSVSGVAFSSTAGGTNDIVCGIYTMSPFTGRPLKLLKQGATITSVGIGIKVSTFAASVLAPGWYFLAMHKQTSDGTQRSLVGSTDLTYGSHTPLGIDASEDQITGFYETKTYTGTLTASPTMSGNLAGTSIAPAMWLRIA